MRIAALHLTQGIEEGDFARWLACLPGKRQAEILARQMRGDRERSLGGEMLARTMLARELRCTPAEVPICREARGKPVVKGVANLFFSISHSGAYAVCAVASHPVGIDIERPRAYLPKAAQRVCSTEELALLAHSDNPARFFCRLWTLKESYVKMTGAGIAVPLRELSFSFTPEGAVLSRQKGVDFQFDEWQDGYCLAVCEQNGA